MDVCNVSALNMNASCQGSYNWLPSYIARLSVVTELNKLASYTPTEAHGVT